MTRKNFTLTPNILFDQFLKELNSSELKILLVIIRQTNGWIDKRTGRRKEKDRITYSQFINKTGLSRRIISEAVNSLLQKKLIKITDNSGNNLNNTSERKGKSYIYYSSLLEHVQSLHMSKGKTSANNNLNQCKRQHQPVQKLHITKETNTKEIKTKDREDNIRLIKKEIQERIREWNI